jgi:small subunit ribosomal protein S17
VTGETRRKERVGVVVSKKMQKTVVVAVETFKRHRIYKKILRQTRRFKAHDERNACDLGDLVRIVETRPLSREKRWRVAEVLVRGEVPEVAPKEIGAELIEELSVKMPPPLPAPEAVVEEAEAVVEPEAPVEEAAAVVEAEAPVEEAEAVVEPEAPVEEAEAVVEPEAPVEVAEAVVEPEAPVEEAEAVVEPEAPVEEAAAVEEPEAPVEEAEAAEEPQGPAEAKEPPEATQEAPEAEEER